MPAAAGSGRPRVLFVSYTADWTGPTNSLVHLLRRLRDRFEVLVLLQGEGALVQELDRLHIRYFNVPRLDKWALADAVRIMRRERVRLVYANNTHGSSRIAFLAAKCCRLPFICHVRGMKWDSSWSALGYLRLADAVVAVSQSCARSVARFAGQDRLHVVYNGVGMEGQAPAQAQTHASDLRGELDLPESAKIILCVSHLCERKGQEWALRSLPAILARHPDAHLCFAGRADREPAYTALLQGMTDRMRLRDRVHFLGFRDDVSSLLRSADLLVHTAVEDPHPRSVLEAMIAGVPVAAFAVDGVAETVADGVTGRLVPERDPEALAAAVSGMLADPCSLKRMASAAIDLARTRFSDEATADRIAQLITLELN